LGGSSLSTNKLNDAANLLLQAGVLQLEGGGSFSERVGSITLGRGVNYLIGSGTFAASQLVRQNRSMLLIQPQVRLDSAPELIGGGGGTGSTNMSIVPWVTDGGFMSYQDGRLIGAPTRADIPAGITSENVRLGTGAYAPPAPVTINALALNGSAFPNVTVAGVSTITISSGVILNTSGGNTITCPIDFGATEGLIHLYGGALNLVGAITGSGGLTVSSVTRNNSTDLFLAGANTYTGTTTFNDGSVRFNSNVLPNTPGPFGNDDTPIVLNDAAILAPGSSSLTFARDLIVRSELDGVTTRFPVINGGLITGNIQLDGILRAAGTLAGPVTGPGTVRVTSSATFSGNNSFSGGIWNSGTLFVGGDSALGTGTTVCSIIAPSESPFSVSTLTAVNGPRTLSNPFLIGNLVVAGASPTTLAGPVHLNGGVTTLSVAAGTPQAIISGPVSDGLLYFNGGRLVLVGSNSQYATTINSGTVTILSSNALGGASGPPLRTSVGTLGTLELFGSLVIPPHRLEIASGSIGLHSILGNSTWSGDVVRTANILRIAVDADILNIAGKLDLGGGSFEKLGNGSLVVGNLRTTGSATISAGTLRVRPNGTDAGVSNVALLFIPGASTPTAKLDLTDNNMVIDYTGASPIANVRAQIGSARGAGSWTGNGITSSIANGNVRALGYADNSILGLGTFMGQPVDATSLIIRQTFYGDSDLDGDVDVNDLGNLASHWQTSGVWSEGDFDYNGFVNAADLGLLASRWQNGVSALASFGLPSGDVPEPWGSGVLLFSTVYLLRRDGASGHRSRLRHRGVV
jgi:autotransporter-associated beta strand protein